MSIMSYNGGTVVAMTGDQCVCIATDLRFGEQMLTMATNVSKVHQLSEKVFLGLCGLATDATTILEKMSLQRKLYELRENRKLKPQVAATMLSNMLYSRRFGSYFTQPIVAGLDPVTHQPYICGMDTIGCICNPKDFVAVGTGEEYCLGVCEGFWREGMKPDECFEATAQALLAALERDASSGNGAVIYTVTKDKVNVTSIKARND